MDLATGAAEINDCDGRERAAERSRERMSKPGNPAEPATIRRTASLFHRKIAAGSRRAVGPTPGTIPSATDNGPCYENCEVRAPSGVDDGRTDGARSRRRVSRCERHPSDPPLAGPLG